jgi:MHS family shikimate/dehydroshikimate transporter-like MFS transporter
LLVGIGYYVRKRVAESPIFERLKGAQGLSRFPVVEAIRDNTRSFLVSAGLKVSENAWVYILTVFIVLYATKFLNLPRRMILDAFLYAAMVEFITIPIFGYLSDKIGRRPLYFFGSLFTIAFVFPLFWLIDSKSLAIITTTVIVALSLGHGTMFGPQAAYFPELFGARVRCSGASTGFQFAAALAGGFSPIISTAILGYTGATTGISLYMMGLALITLVATFFAHETVGTSEGTPTLVATGAPIA